MMSWLPNIQLTFLLMLIYIQNNTYKQGIKLIVAYTTIIGIIYGFTLFTPITFISWSFIFLLKNNTNYGIIVWVSMMMMLAYAPLSILLYKIPLYAYISSDIPFTLIFIVNNVITTMWLKKQLETKYKRIRSE